METQGFRFASSTRNNLLSHIRQWIYFSIYFGLDILPALPENLCMFMELMSNTSSYGHCKNVLSSIKFLHSATGLSFPTDDFGLDVTLQCIKRRLKGTPQFVLPIENVQPCQHQQYRGLVTLVLISRGILLLIQES